MEFDKKKIGLFVVLLVIAGIIFYITSGEGDTTQDLKKGLQQMLCSNPQCNAGFEMTFDEIRKASAEMGPMGGGYLCPECGQKTAQMAEKCPYCEHVFIPNPKPGDFRDRCPKCGKSKMEEIRKSN